MKTLLFNITAAITLPQPRGPEGMANNFRGPQQAPNLYRSHDSSNGTNGTTGQESPDMSLDDLDQARAREIESKALTGIALLLLKWFKISRKYPQRHHSSGYMYLSVLTVPPRCPQI